MSEIQDTDLFLVNRSGTSYKVQSDELLDKLKDDDLMLVNRDDQSYKITGAEFSGSFSKAPVISSVILTEDDNKGDRFTDETFTTTVEISGNPTPAKGIQATVEGSIEVIPTTSEIVGVVNDSNAKTATLTLATNKDLVLFEQGNIVYQDNAVANNYSVVEYRSSQTENQPWSSSSVDNGGSGELAPDCIYWADLSAVKTVESVSFDVFGVENATQEILNNFILSYSTDSASLGNTICPVGCTITNNYTGYFNSDGSYRVNFNTITPFTAQYIGITNGSGSYGGTFRYINLAASSTKTASPVPTGTVSSVDTSAQTMTLTDVVQGSGNPDYGNNGTLSGATNSPINNAPIVNPVDAFDGDLNTKWEPFGGGNGTGVGGSGTPATWTLDDPINYSSKVEFLQSTNHDGMGYIFNNGPRVELPATNGVNDPDNKTWFEVATGSGVFQSFGQYNQNTSATGTLRLFAIRVDGEIVVSGTGPAWSANTGNYVIGPEKTVKVTPETSEITSVIDNNYSSNVSYPEGHPDYFSDPTYMWDGNYTTTRTMYTSTAQDESIAPELVYTFSTPITTTGTIQVIYNGVFLGRRGWKWNDEATVYPTYDSSDITTSVESCPTTITKFTLVDGGESVTAGIFGLKQADGTPIVDLGFELTLSTDKDLTLFEQGDLVYQDNSIDVPIYSSGGFSYPGPAENSPALGMDGSTDTGYVQRWKDGNTDKPTIGYVFEEPISVKSSLRIYCAIDANFAGTQREVWVNNTKVLTSTQDQAWNTLNFTGDMYQVYMKMNTNTSAGAGTDGGQRFKALEVDGVVLVDKKLPPIPSGTVSSVDKSAKTMILTDVNNGTGGTPGTVWSRYVTISGAIEGGNILTNGFDGDIDTQFACYGDIVTFIPPTPFTGVSKLAGKWCGSGGDGVATITAYNGDTVVGSLSGHGGGYAEIPLTGSTVSKIVVERVDRTGWFYISINDSILVDGGTPVWSANTGNYVIGPEKDGNAKLYCKLDENLKVIDLQSADPGYTDFVGNSPQITFPALFPDGKAPDTVLPVGTQMQTKVQATNASGTVTAESNTITPQREVVNVPIHGVRGVPSRKTSLIAQKSINFSNETAGSMALWFKPSILTETQTLFSASSDFLVRIQDSKLYFKSGGSSDLAVVDVTRNVWQQVVMSFDANGSEAWLNGVSVGTSSVKPTASSTQYTLLCEAQDVNHFDGYLSQAVFIVGQKLDATVFGEDIDGKWAPKTTAGIITRVDLDGGFGLAGYFLPFAPIGVDYTKNTIGIDYQGALNNIYNGNVSFTDAARIGLYDKVTLTAAKDIPCTDLVSVYYSSGSLLHPRTLTLNKGLADEAVFTMQTNNGIAVTKADFEFNGIIKSIEFRADARRDDTEYVSPVGLYGFAVDNDILIDHKGVGADVSGSHTNFTSANMQLFAAPAVPGDDSVLDNPTSNYATLQFGTNGNLTATGQSDLTWRGYNGIFYHYEEDGIARFHRGGGTFRSVAGKTYNFGAQPFTKAIPQDYGVLVQTWEEWNFDSLNLRIPGDIAVFNTIKTALKNYEGDRDTFRANLKTTLQNQGITANQIASLGL